MLLGTTAYMCLAPIIICRFHPIPQPRAKGSVSAVQTPVILGVESPFILYSLHCILSEYHPTHLQLITTMQNCGLSANCHNYSDSPLYLILWVFLISYSIASILLWHIFYFHCFYNYSLIYFIFHHFCFSIAWSFLLLLHFIYYLIHTIPPWLSQHPLFHSHFLFHYWNASLQLHCI